MTDASSPAMTWAQYIATLTAEHGSLAAVALKLSLAEGGDADAASIERALRRLRTKEHQDGGQYGRWLLRTFGVPRELEQRAKWMGVYHSRFTDLPVSLCLDQLRLWDRPPFAESRARVWLALGFATCALRRGDLEGATIHLARARGAQGPIAARIEAKLVEAYVQSRKKNPNAASTTLVEVEKVLRDAILPADERACLSARWLDQRAYQRLHPAPPAEADVAGAHALYQRIPTGDVPLFVSCKRESGLAYVQHRLGNVDLAVGHAHNACRHAGDGGFVRLRVAYLGLLAHILGEPRGDEVRARAIRAARALEDEDLLGRVAGSAAP